MIELQQLRKSFGSFCAVDGITLTVRPGEVLGFLGPNGAGKSTTMKMVAGFLPPTGGRALVCGHDVTEQALAVKRCVGYLPEGAPAYPDMTPESFLSFVAEVRGFTGSEKKSRVQAMADRVQLRGVMRQPIETLSKGYKRRVGLAQALIHDPAVLILDEPTDGLDPNQKHEVRQLIRSLGSEKTVILSTHILEEVEAVCTRAVVISRGKIVADCSPSEMQSQSRLHNAVRVRLRHEPPDLRAEIRALDGVADVEDLLATGSRDSGVAEIRVLARGGVSIISQVGELLRSRRIEVDELRVEPGRLDEVFRRLTQAGSPSETPIGSVDSVREEAA